MRCIIAGSRGILEYSVVRRALKESGFWERITVVLSGGASGVDRLGEFWADENARELRQFPADWKRHGRKAGVMRNREMAENADALIAVWDGKSPGTKNMIYEAQKRGLEVYVHHVARNDQ